MLSTIVVRTWLSALRDALSPGRKALRELRERWGKPGTGDGWSASDYFDLAPGRDADACVDAKTWADIEFPQIFASIDTCVTPVGRQVLYRRMRTRVGDTATLASRYAASRALHDDPALRERLQRALLPLRDDEHAQIAAFVFGPAPAPMLHRWTLVVWSLASLLALVGAVAWAWPVAIWIVMAFVNLVVLARVCGRALNETESMSRCLALAGVADRLAALSEHPALPDIVALRAESANRAAVRAALRLLAFLKRPVIAWVAVWLNVAFLLEPIVHLRSMASFLRLRHHLAASFELVGGVDAALAVASWLEYAGNHCAPVLVDSQVLDIRDGRHPLLVDGVANSVRLDGQSALVTGSNMAGKTTFIKMLAANALLGQTLGFCLASAATVPRARVMASIHAAHSVAVGKSRYFSEVETVQAFLGSRCDTGCTIFVIDELFSGTNTVERVAIARAVLEVLGRRALVLATTHDVELQAWLGDRYRLFHFQESPEVDGYFDYALRPGPATERNAIRLLGELGFPDEVVLPAMRYSGQAQAADARSAGHAI